MARQVSAGGPRPRSRRGEGERLRAEVLDAVNQLLGEWGGSEKLTIRAVAKVVGVAPGSIYLHFTDKSELVWAALTGKYEQLAQQMRAADAAASARGPRDRLRAQAHAYCRFAVDSPGHYRLMYEVRQPEVAWSKATAHPARLVNARFREALAACADAGHPLRLPLHQAARTLWTGLHGLIAIQHSLGMPISVDRLCAMADGLVDLVVAPDPGDQPGYPPDTPIERFIAGTVLDVESPG